MSDRLPSRGVFAFVAAVLLTTILVAVPASRADAATYAGHPVPGIWDIRPATGEVVAVGDIGITGRAMSLDGVSSVQIAVDGTDLTTTADRQDDVVTVASATASVTEGQHLAQLTFVDGKGATHQRSWNFSAAPTVTERIAGADRVSTAAKIASHNRQAGAATAAVLARADEFADGLAGTPLAHALDAPLLLSAHDHLSDPAAAALQDLLADGATVHLLGGTAALSADVAAAVEQLGFTVVRHAGEDRFATAASIADAMPAWDHAVVASGTSFPDALAIAAPAAQAGWPILLTAPDRLPDPTRSALSGRSAATIVGGAAVVSTDVENAIASEVPDVVRVAGADRYETAANVARSYGSSSGTIAIASGETFADALAGSAHAALIDAPLVLTRPADLPVTTGAFVKDRQPGHLVFYGGTAAVSGGVVGQAAAATIDDGARLTGVEPAPGTELHNMDQFTLTFATSLDVAATQLSIWFAGVETSSTWAKGDFDNTLVATVQSLPWEPPYHVPTSVRVVGVVRDVNGGVRHVDQTWTYRKIAMGRGDSGPDVQALQDRLRDLHYWIGTPDGTFGTLTVQAVMAFQKYEGLPVTGIADSGTQARLASASRPVAQYAGTHAEVDKTRQVLLFVENGTVDWVFNTSTGTEKAYSEDGHSGVADTPPGTFRVCREYDGLRDADLGTLWRPKYFNCSQGIAIHGASNVPGYPASHGCVRVTYAAIDYLWANDYLPIGRTVIVYGRYPGT